jgi:RNA polymerase sigma-70 factor (ECF subfamily)
MKTFEEVYREHVQAVFRFAMRVTGKRDVAEDVTSEAFLALYRNFDGIDQSQLPAWLLTVVRNRARDLWRRRTVEAQYADQIAQDPFVTPAVESSVIDSPDLKPIHRTCLILRYAYGMSRAEIAHETGLTDTQVRGHLQYALTLLRKAHAGRVA